jgi:hypothetical protein
MKTNEVKFEARGAYGPGEKTEEVRAEVEAWGLSLLPEGIPEPTVETNMCLKDGKWTLYIVAGRPKATRGALKDVLFIKDHRPPEEE